VKRRAGRGAYDRETVHAILDEGFVGHVGLVDHEQPFVIPMLYARVGEALYLHGSPLSRLLGAAVDGTPLCLTVTLVDGLVLARSAFHHSVNYRSVVLLGQARAVRDREEKVEALRLVVEHIAPGRSADARGPNAKELKATEVVAMTIDEGSAKVRTGPPIDGQEDYEIPIWAGVLPLRLQAGTPVSDAQCEQPLPPYIDSYRRGKNG
jgi:uncharacterized protein